MPSVSEPFGIAPLEALALDTPVIVSRRSGVAEALASSLKIDYGDVEDLAAKVLLLLERPALREALVKAGQAELAALRWEKSAEKLLVLYAALTGRPGSGGRRRPAGGRAALAGAAP
jgi:glycosyltransferase involved in cell wall biosynthesis